MAWLKLNVNRAVNLDNISSIYMAKYTECCSLILTDTNSKTYSSRFMTEEECNKTFKLIQSKLFTDEVIDITNE